MNYAAARFRVGSRWMRSMRSVVEYVAFIGTATTCPPRRSTVSCPTTCSVVYWSDLTSTSGWTRSTSGRPHSPHRRLRHSQRRPTPRAFPCGHVRRSPAGPGPLISRTLRSLFTATKRQSPCRRASASEATWPGCKRSKQPLVITIRRPASRSRWSAAVKISRTREFCFSVWYVCPKHCPQGGVRQLG